MLHNGEMMDATDALPILQKGISWRLLDAGFVDVSDEEVKQGKNFLKLLQVRNTILRLSRSAFLP